MLHEDMGRAGFPVITEERRREFLESSLSLTPASQGHSELKREFSERLWVLFAVTAVLLGLACLSLFLASAAAGDREIATRLGGLFGVAAAPVAVRALIAFLPRGTGANALHAAIDCNAIPNQRSDPSCSVRRTCVALLVT